MIASEVLNFGLHILGFLECQQTNRTYKSNIERFKAHYGSSPEVCLTIWEDLKATNVPHLRIKENDDFEFFLMFLYFIKVYPTELQLSLVFRQTEKTCRKYVWYFAERLRALKDKKVSLITIITLELR